MDKSLPRFGYQGGEKYYRRSGRREILKKLPVLGMKERLSLQILHTVVTLSTDKEI